MKKSVIFGLENLTSKGFVLTQGTFDGVHRGHQQVLNQVLQEAKSRNLPSMLLTFHPHPRTVVQPKDWNPQILNSIEEKAQRVLDLGNRCGIGFSLYKGDFRIQPSRICRTHFG